MNTNIYVAGKILAEILSTVTPPAGMTCHVHTFPPDDDIDPQAVNIFITKKLPSETSGNVKYVLCSKTPSDINLESLRMLYDLWPEPLTPSLLKFYYVKLLERLRSEQLNTSGELKHQKRILEMARQDYLTGLATRWYLHEYIAANQDERNVTCIYFDLDNFKKVNDTYGHQAGDRALAATAEMMQRDFSPDGFCARMGGDEFMIVLLGARNADEVEARVSAFMAGLQDYYAGTKTMSVLSVSAGISQKTHGDDKTIDRLIHESDIALYAAKKAGRACCRVYSTELERDNSPGQEQSHTFYLVDYENVHAQGLDGIHKLDGRCTVCIFYSKNASQVTSGLNFGIMETRAKITYHHAEAGTKNALDFQLSSYLGELIAENSGHECKFYIVSRDSGYASLIPFWQEKGVDVELVSDISGNGVFHNNLLAQRIAILTGEVQLATEIAEIIRKGRTKTEVNNSLQKLYRGTKKCGQIYRMIRPLIEDKPGGKTHSSSEAAIPTDEL